MSDEIPIVNATMTTVSIYLSWFLINVNMNFSTAFVGDRLRFDGLLRWATQCANHVVQGGSQESESGDKSWGAKVERSKCPVVGKLASSMESWPAAAYLDKCVFPRSHSLPGQRDRPDDASPRVIRRFWALPATFLGTQHACLPRSYLALEMPLN